MAIRWSPETLASDARYRPDTVRPAVEYAGLVLKARLDGPSFNDGYDCVINALVWDPATGEPRLVSYGSTMGMSGTAEVDSTPEVLAAYAAYEAREAEKRSISAEIRDRKRVDIRGRTVKVVRGRKVPIGTEGVIFWSGVRSFRFRLWYACPSSCASVLTLLKEPS